MHYRTLGKTGIKVSALGFGCMRLPTLKPGEPAINREKAIKLIRKGIDSGINYVDTAYPYHDKESEIVLGMALKDGYREKVTLVTKCPVGMPDFTEPDHYNKYLEEQLRKLDVDYLDVYLFHGLNGKTFKEKVIGLNLIERAKAAKAAGKIRHIGFSFHDKPEVLKEIIDTGHFEVMLVQYNIVDPVNKKMLAYATEKGLGVAIMGPVGGGRLAGDPPPESMQQWLSSGRTNFVDLALKFVFSNPNVSVVLSGMGSEEMLNDNLSIVSRDNYNVYLGNEEERIQNIATKFKELSDVICTDCKYCEPCPNEVNISFIFRMLIRYQVYGVKEAKRWYSQIGKVRWAPGKDATACVECGECLEKCPQNIPIIDQLKEAHTILGAE